MGSLLPWGGAQGSLLGALWCLGPGSWKQEREPSWKEGPAAAEAAGDKLGGMGRKVGPESN